MQNSEGLRKKTTFITALVLIIGLPVSSFAFRNPNQDPRDIVKIQENADISTSAPSAVNTLTTELQDDKKGDDSVNQAAAVLKTGEISAASPTAASLSKANGFGAFNSLNQNRWQATFSIKTGLVKHLYGAKSKAYGDTPENSAREFLKDTHMLFGIQSDLSDLETHSVNQTAERQHIRFQQTFNGVSVQGAQIIVHSDLKGCVTMVQNDCPGEIAPVNQNLLSLEAARDIARNALSLQLGPQANLAESIAENLIIPYKGAYAYIWKITTPTKTPPGLWVYHVDAQSGEIVYRGDEIFYMTDGRGRVYIDNEEWFLGKKKNVKLEELYETEDGSVEGFLRGEHATIHDYPLSCTQEEYDNSSFDEKCKRLDGYNLAFSSKLKFVYNLDNDTGDFEPGSIKPYFDQVQAYYQTTAVWQWWEDNVIKKYGPNDIDYFYWLSIPTVVNMGEWDKDGNSLFCNAFYTPLFFMEPPYGDVPGFAFADDESCFDEDLVIDVSIVRHEYAHAIMDWAHFDDHQFGGEVNGYGRSMGEGNADWYAFLPSGQPAIGYVAWPPWGTRNIDIWNRYPDDVNDPGYYEYDVEPPCPGYAEQPEEHYTGLIWGGYLYELSRVLKKQAPGFVYQSSFYFRMAGGHRDGYPDFVDAVRAQRDAEFDRTGSNTLFLKAFGSMVSRGFIRPLAPLYSNDCDYFGTGAPGSDERDYLYLSAPLNLKTEANLLVTDDLHEYPVEARAGMLLTAKVSAKSLGMRGPTIELFKIDGTRLTVTDYGNNTKVKKATLSYTIPENGIYVVRVSGTAEPRRGYYTMQLKVDYDY